ncbi:histidinol-phosphatase HisJ [Gracilibacillus sp. S3-1-1]|uniref:Histidinol-phosphatase HisJ n=1 Tax=Gracilibacillus pellucidus TaxID=3095368 RepID=A0ACC6M7V4_9BACI|nr:histidinol-phosphatase HisJ [Gracilibacillus sp. S3-1-1]MDX8047061.1 histidinol-phosphatase HisJ [Gracilibacillus sp. S3-1-1]
MQFDGDYHVHTQFCPHGSDDTIEQYIETAIQKGLKEITFTEHAPLPSEFVDPTPDKDSAMAWEDVERYIAIIERCKKTYESQIKINLGFELDYIEGYEDAITSFLKTYGPYIDDAILSVHMLRTPDGRYVCIDFSDTEFAKIIRLFGSIEAVYDKYYQTVEKAIVADLGPYKPNRIGHLTLIHKYQRKYAVDGSYTVTIERLLDLIVQRDLELDINTAGLYKADCLELYPPQSIINKALAKGIRWKPGSDSHSAETIARGFDQLTFNK